MYAAVYLPPVPNPPAAGIPALVALAQEFSPRYERHRDDLIAIDVSGLDRVLGDPRAIGHAVRREAAARGLRAHVAVAGTQTAALVLAQARPGLTLVEPGDEADALAPIPIGILEKVHGDQPQSTQRSQRNSESQENSASAAVSAVKRWGLKTLGDLAALPAADLAARLGQAGLVWQAIARGEDVRPLVPARPEERFISSLDLEWPIEGLEPLSFVLTRLLEPLSIQLERRDRGAAVLHVQLGLVTRAIEGRRLQLPSPIRDVRSLRTLALLDLESHPPSAAIDRVTLVIDPTPGRVLQHTLFTRAHPTPEQLSTLLARLGALMGSDRVGAAALVDSYRPGAFAMTAFATEHNDRSQDKSSDVPVVSALRRCRYPVPARVAVDAGRPVRVTTDRRGFAGGHVRQCAGPWRTSGEWWNGDEAKSQVSSLKSGTASDAGSEPLRRPVLDTPERNGARVSGVGVGPHAFFNRDEWEVALSDGAVYRIFQDRETDGWFIDAIVD